MTDAENEDPNTASGKDKSRPGFIRWLRNRFFTGLVIALPILATTIGLSWLVRVIDNSVLRFVPEPYGTYFDAFPGSGLIIAVVLLFILGVIASNFIGHAVINASERLLARVPVVSSIYNALKQIVTTVAQQKDRAFRDVCLIEYPRPGLWAIGFVTADLSGAPLKYLPEGHVCVFVPTTPNPTSGFLLFVLEKDIKILDMTPEEGAKMIISGGMVSSNEDLISGNSVTAKNKKLSPPS